MATFIYIDDTGNAQHRSDFKYDTSMSASWCAILLNEKQHLSALNFMSRELKELYRQLELDEFHFADIFSGKGIYRHVENRLDFFKEFSAFSSLEQYVVLFQSFAEDDYERLKIKKTHATIDGFKLYDYSDFALYNLLLQIGRFLYTNSDYTKPCKIVIDEGRCKNNSYQNCSILGNILENGKILYKSSKEEPLLQLADFTAYTLNHCNWLDMKNSLNEYDKKFLKIASLANFNVPFLKKNELNIDSDRRQIYEQYLDEAYKKSQSYPELNLDEFVTKCIIPK